MKLRLLLGLVAIAFLAGCMPDGPTGDVVAPPTHYIDGSQVLISAEPFGEVYGTHPVRLTVRGDLVYETLLVDGRGVSLSGGSAAEGWLSERGTVVVRLEPGEHTVRAYSCFDTLSGWKCGCRSEDNCGYWMERSLTVE